MGIVSVTGQAQVREPAMRGWAPGKLELICRSQLTPDCGVFVNERAVMVAMHEDIPEEDRYCPHCDVPGEPCDVIGRSEGAVHPRSPALGFA